MKRTLLTMMVFLFLASTLFPLPKCLPACPLGIPELKVGDEPIKEASHSQQPCCAKKNDARQKSKHPVSCPLLLGKSQPQAAATLLKTVPDLQRATSAYSPSHVPVGHSESFDPGEFPDQGRSTPIILQKQSLLI
jgi:hypothetical protein